MSLIELLEYYAACLKRGDSRADAWAALRNMGVNAEVRSAIVDSVNDQGKMIRFAGEEWVA